MFSPQDKFNVAIGSQSRTRYQEVAQRLGVVGEFSGTEVPPNEWTKKKYRAYFVGELRKFRL